MINSTQCSHVSQCAIAVSRRSGTSTSDERLAWFTLRHKHNECSHLLHKHKESDIRKRNELQNEAVGVWDEARFQNGRRRNSPAAFAALQMPDTFLPTTFLSRLHLFPRFVNVQLPVLTQKVF